MRKTDVIDKSCSQFIIAKLLKKLGERILGEKMMLIAFIVTPTIYNFPNGLFFGSLEPKRKWVEMDFC